MKTIVKMTFMAAFCGLFTTTLSAQEVTVVKFGTKDSIKIVGFGSVKDGQMKIVDARAGETVQGGSVRVINFVDSMVNIVTAEEALVMMKSDGEKAKLIYVGKLENNRSKTAFGIERKTGNKAEILRETYPQEDTKLYIVGDSEFLAKMLANELQIFNHFDKQYVYVVKGDQEEWLKANPKDKK